MLEVNVTYKTEVPHDVKMAMVDRISKIEVDKTKVATGRMPEKTFDKRVDDFELDVAMLPSSDFKSFLIEQISELREPPITNSDIKWYQKLKKWVMKIADILFI